MAPQVGLEHIQEGFAYKDGEPQQLYVPGDGDAAKSVLFKKCFDYHVGPLTLNACLDTNGPEVDVTATLLGIELASCHLSAAHSNCTIGGSVDGFKAEADLTLNDHPLVLAINGQLCAPFVGCHNFATTVPL